MHVVEPVVRGRRKVRRVPSLNREFRKVELRLHANDHGSCSCPSSAAQHHSRICTCPSCCANTPPTLHRTHLRRLLCSRLVYHGSFAASLVPFLEHQLGGADAWRSCTTGIVRMSPKLVNSSKASAFFTLRNTAPAPRQHDGNAVPAPAADSYRSSTTENPTNTVPPSHLL